MSRRFDYTNGLNIRPQRFPAQFIPRREAIEALIELERYNTPTKLFVTDEMVKSRRKLK